MEFKIQYDEFLKRKNTCLDNEFKAFAKLWEYCFKALQGKVEARIDYASSIFNNPIKLGEAIKEHSLNFKETRYEIATIIDVLHDFILCK